MAIIHIRKGYCSFAYYNGLDYIYPGYNPECEVELDEIKDKKFYKVRRDGNNLRLLTYNAELEDKTIFLKEVLSVNVASVLEDGSIDYSDEALEMLTENFKHTTNTYEIGNFLLDFIERNKFVYSLFVCNDNFRQKIKSLLNSKKYEVPMIIFKNIVRNGLDTIEKIYKGCGEDFFISNVCSSEMEFQNERKKLKQIIGLPDNVLQFLKEKTYSTLYPVLKELAENRSPNDVSLLINFVSMAIEVSNKYPVLSKGSYYNFIKTVAEIANLTDTSMKAIINYLYTQSFNYSDSGSYLTIPTSEAITMRDYLSIAKKYNIDVDPLPSNIRAAHFYLVNNTSYADNEEKNELFKQAVNKYAYLEFTGEKFSILTPKDIKDMIDEGNNMHHCIASYVDRVINGQIVLFCRKNEELNTSFVSFEVSPELEFVQIKEKYDADVTDVEVLEFLNEWQQLKTAEIFEREEKEAI